MKKDDTKVIIPKTYPIIDNVSQRLADLCTFHKTRTVKSYVELDYDRIKEIFDRCY